MRAIRLFIVVVPLLLAGPARAQSANVGFQLDRYEPTPAGESFFMVEHPWYSSVRWFAGGLTLDYAHNPLVAGTVDNNGFHQSISVIQHQLVLHVDLAASFLDRVLVETSIPFTVYEAGTAAIGVAPILGAPGDLRLGVFVRLFGHADRDPVSLSFGAHLWIPVGEKGNYTGDDNVRGMPVVTLGGFAVHHLVWSFNVAFMLRASARLGTLSDPNGTGSEFRLSGAIAYADRRQNLQVGPELAFGTLISDGKSFRTSDSSLELLLGFKYTIAELIQLGAAVGLGTLREAGTPDARVLFRIAYAPKRKEPPAPIASPPPETPTPRAPVAPPPPSDRDNDGVLDSDDKCPDEPAGATPDTTRPGCPDKDSDGDGVVDSKDNCPETPAGPHADSRRPGCPAPDSDLDNVFDDVDACPDKPGLPNADPAKNGCPLPDKDNDGIPDEMDACPDRPGVADPDAKLNGCPRIKVSRGEMTVLQPVFFATNEETILPQSFPLLQTIASSLMAQPQLKRVSIEGHADDRGGTKFNQVLSERRAASVMKFLIEHGVAPARLESHGYGSTRPVTPQRDEESRARNRRVEFRILQREATP